MVGSPSNPKLAVYIQLHQGQLLSIHVHNTRRQLILQTTHVGVASSYGPYGSAPAGYNPSSASTAGNSTLNEDLNTPQFKENNVYIAGQQVGF